MQQILARYPQVELRIVGDTGAGRPVSDRIRFLGVRRDIPEILADTDIFVYTPYPNLGSHDLVVLEASAAGVPCVVADTNAVRESVIDGRNGFLTPFGDVDTVVDRVGRLVLDARLRASMSCAAREVAREQFDMTEVARRYELVYRTLLDVYRSRHVEPLPASQAVRRRPLSPPASTEPHR
jgi:glycosyltransferase involved in cell wall biosynthesis